MTKLACQIDFRDIEAAISKHLGRSWRVRSAMANEVEAMHDAALLQGDDFDVFVKVGTNPFSLDQFHLEAQGLRKMTEASGVATPEVIDIIERENSALLVMKAVDVKPLDDVGWAVLGRGLAQLHRATWDRCGLEHGSYLGIFPQDNRPMEDWPTFYGERRLRVQMKMAVDAGNMTVDDCRPVERLISRLPQLCGEEEPFSLLHGDPWPGNLLYDGRQLVMIDCSIYYGHREIDLSTVDFFYPVPDTLFAAYHECYPISPGYSDRKALWQVNQWLGHVTLFGQSYMEPLMGAVKPYL